jgi:hypothetical protein
LPSSHCEIFEHSELTILFQRQVNWILWSVVTDTAFIIIPEEAELCLPLVHDSKEPLTHLLTYAAPVTRKMLHFNNLKYYAVPALPTEWEPPNWLALELGILAGRLYLEFGEYSDLRKYLGSGEDSAKLAEIPDDAEPPMEFHEAESTEHETVDEKEEETEMSVQQAQSFTAKPLTFLQEWLAIRRKGQDFTHTPMGYVCQGKPLVASHPFFTRSENDEKAPRNNPAGVRSARGAEGGDQSGVRVWADDDLSSDQDFGEDDDDYYIDEGEGEENERENDLSDQSERSDEEDYADEDGPDSDGARGTSPLSPPLSKIPANFP